jgi:pSer/pThr/pTyr-binding forkhead associated (FHA) protein
MRNRLLDLEERLKRLAGESGPSEPLEIRQAVIQQIVDQTHPTGRGRRVLPFDRVDVDVVAETAEARRVIDAVLQRDEGLDASVQRALETAGCTPPPRLRIDVRYRKRPSATWAPGQRFAVTGQSVAEAPAATRGTDAGSVTAEGARPAVVSLRVLKGRAARRSVEVTAERINLGRGDEVTDRDRRLVRRNDLAFTAGDEIGDTVSRAHAHISCGPSGECRLRDDGSAHGTRIVRGGRTIEVTPGNPRGVKLQTGDEIVLGKAVVRVTRAARILVTVLAILGAAAATPAVETARAGKWRPTSHGALVAPGDGEARGPEGRDGEGVQEVAPGLRARAVSGPAQEVGS